MNYINKLDEIHLLKHDFYQEFSSGGLTKEDLQEYTFQYYKHVANFPRYLSSIHSNCDDITVRKVLLGNLIDEENGEEDHPELFLKFAEGMGLKREQVKNAKLYESTLKLDAGFFAYARSSVPEGIGALFAYERQMSDISKVKMDDLEKFYGIKNPEHLKFFAVHVTADEWHSQECIDLINNMEKNTRDKAYIAAINVATLLWNFLDTMEQVRKNKNYLNVVC